MTKTTDIDNDITAPSRAERDGNGGKYRYGNPTAQMLGHIEQMRENEDSLAGGNNPTLARIFHQTGPNFGLQPYICWVCGLHPKNPICTDGLRGC